MSVGDFATTLASLMHVCRSAAAGQLHLASVGDSEPPSLGQTDGGAPQQLEAGICARQDQGSVSAKVRLGSHPYHC